MNFKGLDETRDIHRSRRNYEPKREYRRPFPQGESSQSWFQQLNRGHGTLFKSRNSANVMCLIKVAMPQLFVQVQDRTIVLFY
jgi:hypothetical protein